MTIEVDIELAEKLMAIEMQLGELDDQFHDEQLVLAEKYALLKKPILETRDTEAKAVPNFWSVALTNNSFIKSLAFPTELPLLEKLTSISIERGEENNFKILFAFEKNEYFSNEVLVKEVNYDDNSEPSVVPENIKWAKGKRFFTAKKAKASASHDHGHSHEATGFFGWLQDDDSCSANYALFISEELYPNAGKFYAGEGEDDESEGDYEDMEDDQ